MVLDAETGAYIDKLRRRGLVPLEEQAVAQARAVGPLVAARIGPGPEVWRCRDVAFHGIPEPAIRLLQPSGRSRGIVVFIHGGGWVLGDATEIDTLGRILANRTGCTVALVNYRKAPEHPYPAAVDDCWRAVSWVARHADELSETGAPLIVGGESAGGNLAAVTALRARDEGWPRIDLQLLVCPIVDADFDTPSYLDDSNQLTLTRSGMRWFWDQYAPAHRRTEQTVSPLRASGHAGLPASVVLIAEHDVLRSEDERYVQALRAAGVDVRCQIFPGQMHGFFSMINILPGSVDGVSYAVDHIKAVLHN